MSMVPKGTGEKFQVGFRYTSDRLDAGQTISSCVVSISPSGLTEVGAPNISNNVVTQIVSGGTAGVEYYMTFTTTLSDGSNFIDDIVVMVS